MIGFLEILPAKMAAQHEISTILQESQSNINSVTDPTQILGLPYPQGCIQWYTNGMIIAAGGGGPTKSGKANGFEILQFNKSCPSSVNKFNLQRHSWYNTGPDIVYCIRQHPVYCHQFIAGIGNNLVIMEISSYSKPTQSNAFTYDFTRISQQKFPSNDPIFRAPISTIHMESNIESTPLPFEEDPHCVHKVEISANGKLIACGGTDGIVRIFNYDFVDPQGKLSLTKSVDICQQHFELVGREKKSNEAPPEIERLLFYQNKFLSICNREFCCYIWNIEAMKMETILMDTNNPNCFIFRDCAFLNDVQQNVYCVCAVNGVRKSRKARNTWSYLYQYYVSDSGWFRIKYVKVMKCDIIRMIADTKTKNVITLHLNGMINVFDGLNLTKLYSFKNDGRFFMDIAISPGLYGDKGNGYTEYLLIALMNDLLIKPIKLEPCYMGKVKGGGGCCTLECFSILLAIVVAFVAVTIGLIQQTL